MSAQHLTIAIEGPGCGGCDAPAAERVLQSVPGVLRAYVNPATEMAYIEYDTAIVGPDQVVGELHIALESVGLSAGELAWRSLEIPSGGNSASAAIVSHQPPAVSPRATSFVPGPSSLVVGSTVVIALAFVAVALLLLFSGAGAGASNAYTLEMNRAGFRPAALVIPAGVPIALTVRNTEASSSGGSTTVTVHQFAIDELGLNLTLPPGQSRTVTLPPMKPGSYHYYCDACCGGRRNADMLGALIVH